MYNISIYIYIYLYIYIFRAVNFLPFEIIFMELIMQTNFISLYVCDLLFMQVGEYILHNSSRFVCVL